jgi:hypothetical protein
LNNYFCFAVLSVSLQGQQNQLALLANTVFIAEAMRDPVDEAAVVAVMKHFSEQLLQTVQADRPSINELSGQCHTNYSFAAKAQETLNLYDAITSLLRSILKRL